MSVSAIFFVQESVPFSPADSRLAVIQFGSQVKTDLTFEESTQFGSDFRGLEDRIRSIERLTGLETNTAKALQVAAQLFESNVRCVI